MFSKRLLSKARDHQNQFVFSILFSWLGGVATILQAWLIARIVNDVFLEGRTLQQLQSVVIGLAATMLAKALFAFLAEATANRLSIGIRTGLRHDLLEKITRLGPAYTGAERTGELSMTLLDGVESLDAYFSQYIPQLALSASLPITILLLVFPIDLLTGVVFVLTAPLIPFFMIMIGRYGEQLTNKQYSSLSILSAHFFDVLQGIATLKVFGRSKKQIEVIGQMSGQYREITMRVLRVTFLSSLALELLATLSTAIVAVEIGFRLLYGKMEFLPAFFILIIAPEFYFPLRQLGLKFHAGMNGVSASVRIWQVLDEPEPEIRYSHMNTAAPEAVKKADLLQLKKIGFSYSGRDAFRLQDVTLDFPKGSLTALVGKTGAGKSSIFNLLLGFSQPQSGQILLDGHDISEISLDAWRAAVAYVPQSPTLFFDSIRNNLLFAKPNATQVELDAACQKSGLLPFIASLPQGLDTMIGDRGARLSGGQAQRLALARAFLKDAPILLLDEPSSNLDPALEDELSAWLRELAREKIVVVIAHRQRTAQNADRIYIIENGNARLATSTAQLGTTLVQGGAA